MRLKSLYEFYFIDVQSGPTLYSPFGPPAALALADDASLNRNVYNNELKLTVLEMSPNVAVSS
jgi:hypothetical protein